MHPRLPRGSRRCRTAYRCWFPAAADCLEGRLRRNEWALISAAVNQSFRPEWLCRASRFFGLGATVSCAALMAPLPMVAAPVALPAAASAPCPASWTPLFSLSVPSTSSPPAMRALAPNTAPAVAVATALRPALPALFAPEPSVSVTQQPVAPSLTRPASRRGGLRDFSDRKTERVD